MSKFLTTAALVVGGIALAATGYGLAVDATVGLGGTAVIGTVAVSTIAQVASVAAGVASLGARLLAHKNTAATPTEWRADPDQGIDLVFGDAYNSGGITYRQTYGDDNKYEGVYTCWSLGPVDSINQLYIDGVARGLIGQAVQIPDQGFMYENRQLGLCPETTLLQVDPVNPYGWTAECMLSGKAMIADCFVYDTKGKNTQTSIPNCGWRGKGLLGYDARKDSTYPGGNGPQRANDQTTWAWSNNMFVMGLTFAIGWRQNGKLAAGVGIPITSIYVDQFVEAANVADANGWTFGGTKSTTDDPWDVLTDILQAGSGEPMRLSGRLGCFVNTPRVRLATITRDDLAKGAITLPG